ncbi:MAG: HAMP domain-containing sensor histidine kinase [Cyanobacteriota bacterium]|nr:HAMP domain-containing sensor histidine kinase [Cyanobacteriota bacterium]
MAWDSGCIPTMPPDLAATRRQLSLRYAAFVAGLLAVFALGVYGQVSRSSQELLRRQAERLAATAAAELPLLHHESDEARAMLQARRLEALPGADEANGLSRHDHRVLWLDDELRLLQSSGDFQPDGPMRATSDWRRAQWLPSRNGVVLWRPVLGRKRGGAAPTLHGYVSVALATEITNAELGRLRQGLLSGAILASLLALAGSQRMVAASLRPLQRQIERLTTFTADASHELRQPLTALRALIGSLRHGDLLVGAPAALEQKLAQIDQTSARMGRLVDDLLLLTRYDRAIDDRPSLDTFPLEEMVDDLIDLHQAEAEAAGLRLQGHLEGCLRVRGSPERLRRLLENLLSNALRFSPPGGTVLLELRRQMGVAWLSVEDQGPGIAPELRERVFDRFWQADPARGGAEHHGLGLAIARAIARSHGGELRAEQAAGGGCRMVLELPLAG